MLLANQISGFFKMKYRKKEVNDEVYFWHADKLELFYKLILSFWVCIAHGCAFRSVYGTFSSRMRSSRAYFLLRQLTNYEVRINFHSSKNLWFCYQNMRKHNMTLFIECLATEIVKTYKHLAGISEEQEKQWLQKWRQNNDFWRFLIINISKLCHRILIIFFLSNMQLDSFWLTLYLCHLHFFNDNYHPFSKP